MSNLTTFPSADEFKLLKEIGKMAIDSGFLPNSVKNQTQAVIIMLKGRELGIPPMQAFQSIYVVNNRTGIAAELMLSLIFSNVKGAVVNFLETTGEKCLLEAQRPGGKMTKFKFDMDDARKAGLAGKGPWVTYPAAMLRARCISAMARAMFPDALRGNVYTPEELGAETNYAGEVIDIPKHDPVSQEEIRPAALTAPTTPFDSNDHADANLTCLYCDAELSWDTRKKKYECTKAKEGGKHIRAFGEDELQNYKDTFMENKAKILGLAAPEGA